MIAVLVMQAPVDQIVDVVAVRHRFVSAAGAVHVTRLVVGAAVLGIAAVGVAVGDLDHVLVDVICMQVVKVPVVQVVDVVAVLDGDMAAPGTMLVGVVVMLGV
jgi:hypothetical protein